MTKIQLKSSLEGIVEMGRGKELVDDFLEENSAKNIIFISDEKIWKNCANFFSADFLKKFNKILLLKNPKADEKNLEKIAAQLKNIELIFALGSGAINDLCKMSSAQKNIPYAVCASAASMNGYLSKNASITIKNHKKTLPATLPKKVFCNLDILKNAPPELTKAGVGDVLCFYSCYFDWYLSHKILGTKFDEEALKISQKKIDFFIKNYQKFSLKDDDFLRLLIELLLISGYAMTMAGGSYPASQSEHMIAHTIEMKFPKIAQKLLHGQIIAVTSLTALKLQKALLSRFRSKCEIKLDEIFKEETTAGSAAAENDARFGKFAVSIKGKKLSKFNRLAPSNYAVFDFFGAEVATQCFVEYEEKLLAIKSAKNLDQKSWKKLRKICMDEAVLKNIFKHFKIKISAKSLGLSSLEYQECVAFAKYSRNRFSCLDLT